MASAIWSTLTSNTFSFLTLSIDTASFKASVFPNTQLYYTFKCERFLKKNQSMMAYYISLSLS